MNWKKLFIFLTLAFVLFSSISLASAQDGADEINASDIGDSNTLNMANEIDVLSASGTFTQLDNAIKNSASGSTITLDRDYSYTDGDSKSGIVINKDITIDGRGFTLDGAGQSSIFKISGSSTVVLRNINFINAFGSNGAAISWTSSDHVNVFNSKFINNTALGNGGAIYISSNSKITFNSNITDSVFVNNKAVNGGSIYVRETALTVVSSTFSDNLASNDGGSIFLDTGAYIDNCVFTSSVANHDGGALFINSTLTDFSLIPAKYRNKLGIFNSRLTSCRAGYNGGSAYIYVGGGTVANVTVINCSAGNDGGAGYIDGNHGSLVNSTFINNFATRHGGAVMWRGVNGTIYNSTFLNSSTLRGNGGAIYLSPSNNLGVLDGMNMINRSKFKSNVAKVDGGAIYCAGMFAAIFDTVFSGDNALDGAGIYLDVGIAMENCTFSNERALHDGGALYLFANNPDVHDYIAAHPLLKYLGTSDSQFINCTAGHDGGAAYVAGDHGSVSNSSFIDCWANHDGGAITWEGDYGRARNITCIHNTVGGGSGSLCVYGSNLNISDSTFLLSGATLSGGAIYVYGDNVSITKSLFDQCSAIARDGGAISVSGLNVQISDCNFTRNKVNAGAGHGGAIFIQGKDTQILRCGFAQCTAFEGGFIYINGTDAKIINTTGKFSFAVNGGAFYVSGDNATIYNSQMSYNNATTFAGSIYVEGDFVTIDHVNFTRCISYNNGAGAIYVRGLNTTISNSVFSQNIVSGEDACGGSINVQGDYARILNSTFDKCTAKDGGVIYINGTYTLIDGYSCMHCFAYNNGGAIYIAGDYATVSNFNMSLTNATNYGGAIYIGGDHAKVFNSNFERCIANNYHGGALYILGFNATISNSNFIQNRVNPQNGRGGSIEVQGNHTWILNSTFDMCQAYEGGIIYINGSHTIIDGFSSTRCIAFNDGGAIYINGDNAVFADFKIALTNATNNGGAIYVAGDNTSLYNCNLDSCIVVNGDGGSIYVGGHNTTVDNCTFDKTQARNGNGGAIFLEGDLASVENSNFMRSFAYNGGIIYILGHDVLIDNSNFTYSWCVESGGSIYVEGDGAVISNSNFAYTNASSKYNEYAGYGGAIYIFGDGVNITSSTFTHTISEKGGNGGAIFIFGENVTIEKSNFTNTTAPDYFEQGGGASAAGAISIAGNDATISQSNFNYCHARNAGAMFVAGTNTKIIDSNITDCFADGDGGAIYIFGEYTNISGTIFYDCHNNRDGGAIFILFGENTNVEHSTFIKCYANNGGAMFIEGSNVLVRNSLMTDCFAETDGGSIYITGNNISMVDSNFTNCYVNQDNGGAIYWIGSVGLVNNSNFINNTAPRLGGAIFMKENSKITFQNSHFINNSAGINGGAIDFNRGAHDEIILNSTFENNIANRSAGAVFWFGTNGTIRDSTFRNNTALGIVNYTDSYGNVTYGGFGGAVMWTGAQGVVDNCTFIGNYAQYNEATKSGGRGGAVYLQGSDVGNGHDTAFYNSIFINNTAGYNGGAVDWFRGAANGRVENSTFINNTAYRSGGGIYWSGVNGTIKNSTFFNNSALGALTDSNGGGDGGAVLWVGPEGLIDTVNFTNNKAAYSGGAIFLKGTDNGTAGNCSNVFIENGIFKDNFAHLNGGAVTFQKGAMNGTLSNSVFVNNTALRNGGAIFWFGRNGTVANSTFIENRALGLVDVDPRGVHKYVDENDNEVLGGSGGAVAWIGEVGSVDDSNFINNTARRLGGAIFLRDNSNTGFRNDRFINNTAGINGGAIDFNRGAHAGTIVNSTFENNVANRSAGAVFWFGTNGTIKDSTFRNNSALGIVNYTDSYGNVTYGGFGGAVMWTGAQGVVDSCTFVDNYAQYNEATKSGGRGGAVYLQGSDVGLCMNTTFSNSLFINNTAGFNGGAVAWFRGARNGNIDNSTFINNTARRSGGAISWSGINGTVSNSNFFNNAALGNLTDAYGGGDGGAILWVGQYGHLMNSKFFNNNATYSGGAIFLKGSDDGSDRNCSDVYIDGSIFEDNFAGLNGGAITFQRGAMNGRLSGSTFTNNTALRNGGALFWYGYNGTVIGSNFTDNNALGLVDVDSRGVHQYIDENGNPVLGGSGGAIAWVRDVGTINDSNFINNTAARLGGAVYLRDNSNTVFNNDNFINNAAGINGGAIDFNRGAHAGTIVNSTFENNVANRSAGAVFWFGTNGTIKDSTFKNNTALGIVNYTDSYGNVTYGGFGGAVMWTGAQGVVDSCTFIGNYAQYNEATKSGGRGGAVYLQGSDVGLCMNTTFSNSLFINNTAGFNGGAVAWFRGARNGNIDNSTFINNTARRSGGAISWSGINGTVANSNFINNAALGNLTDAYGGGDGGAILWIGQKGRIMNSSFTDNVASYSGGAIFLKGSDDGSSRNCDNVTIQNSIFKNNVAGLNGGAVNFQEGAIDGKLIDSIFKNNTALRNGGAVFWYGQNGLILGCDFSQNSVLGLVDEDERGVHKYIDSDGNKVLGGSGGAVAWTGDVGSIKDSKFTNNSAKRFGGAIFLRDNVNTIYDNSSFVNNTASQGGAIYWKTDSEVNLTNCVLIGNIAHKGSAIYLVKNNMNIYNSTLLDNRADSSDLILTVLRSDDNRSIEIIAEFKGMDNLINAIWNDGNISLTNVTYLGYEGVVNSGNGRIVPIVLDGDAKPTDNNCIYQTQYEDYQNITFKIYDKKNRLLVEETLKTNISGMATFKYTGSSDELYELVAHPNDNYYTGIENSTSKKLVNVEITTSDIYYLENESFIVNVVSKNNGSETPIGTVSVWINDVFLDNFTLTDGKTAPINLSGLICGTYGVKVNYNGDEVFLPKENSTQFKVKKIPSFIKLDVENYTHGETGKVIIQVPQNENNTILININGQDYPIKVNETGYAEFTIPEVGFGKYVIKATYPATNNYLKSTSSKAFEIYPIINVNIVKSVNVTCNVYVNELVNFTITISNDGEIHVTDVNVTDKLASGFAYVSSNGNHVDDEVIWKIDNLANGSKVTLWAVLKLVDNGTFENSATVMSKEGGVNESNAVNITADPIVDLAINKTVSATEVYVGDEIEYVITVYNNGPSTATNVNVSEKLSKNLSLVKMNPLQGRFDENDNMWYIGSLPSNSKATLTLTLKAIVNGTVENNVSVKSSQKDSDESNNKYACKNVTVSKKDSPIIVNVNDITYGDDAQITLTVPDDAKGNVKITVGNQRYDLPVENGHVSVTLSGLASGKYDVEIDYSGDDVYLSNSTSDSFEVSKFTPTIRIDVVDILLGETEVVNITVNAPGSVSVTVGNKTVEIPLDDGVETTDLLQASAGYNGKATWRLINLPVGTYNAFALYKGNENYSSVNASAIFHVNDIKTAINVEVEDVQVGEDVAITIEVDPKDATGNMTVAVDGKNYTVMLDDGKATLTLSNFKAGKHDVTVYFDGDAPYASAQKSVTFNVLKQKAEIEIDIPEVDKGEDAIITVVLPYDATGTVTIEVDGKRYTSPVEDGLAVFVIPGLGVGEHDVMVYYSGGDKYEPLNESSTITVNPGEVPDKNVTKKDKSISHGVLSARETGNPIILLILVLFTIGSVSFKKFEK